MTVSTNVIEVTDQTFEQVVVDMDAVEGGRGRLHLMAPGQVVSRKMREGLSRSHALARN